MKNNTHNSNHAIGNTAAGNTTTATPSSYRSRIYRTTGSSNISNTYKWSTREIAALDFLLGIPLEAEQSIIKAGVEGESSRTSSAHGLNKLEVIFDPNNVRIEDDDVYSVSSRGQLEQGDQRWWEKLIMKEKKKIGGLELEELERPGSEAEDGEKKTGNPDVAYATPTMATLVAPGRRLEGRDAVVVAMPKTVIHSKRPSTESAKTRQHNVTYLAAVREWEANLNMGFIIGDNDIGQGSRKSLLDGRVFFSSRGSYPVGVFSVVKYEPKKEEAARRRKKLEELGGGGTQFVMPQRDWRGVSYRSLLSRLDKTPKAFNRYHRKSKPEHKNESSSSSSSDELSLSSSSDESDTYQVGFLDDPMIVQGKHRHVMIGDKNTGPILSSTILFVSPQQLKKELNKQFRERFDGWEPPKKQRKYIGARIIDGIYTLHDPTDSIPTTVSTKDVRMVEEENDASHLLKMPPSLTLSKIRNIKEQALYAGVKADLEISTVALSCIYFERLALDCRVDKSNRRLAFAACLLLASKINESNVAIVHNHNDTTTNSSNSTLTPVETKSKYFLPAKVRQTNKGTNMFVSLLEFFTHDWSLSLKHVFAAEWGVFVALGFDLNATPTQISFHFKRLMKELERNPLPYLGHEMYTQWQQCLQDDAVRKERHEKRKEKRRRLKERKLLQLQRDLQLIQERKQQGEESRRSSFSLKGRSSISSSISDGHSRRNSNYSIKQPSLEIGMSSGHNTREEKSSTESNTNTNLSNASSKNHPPTFKVFHISHSATQLGATPSSSTINRSKSVSSFPSTEKATSTLDRSKPPIATASSKKLWNRIMTAKRQTDPTVLNHSHHPTHVLDEDGSINSENHEKPNDTTISRSLSYPNISSMDPSNIKQA